MEQQPSTRLCLKNVPLEITKEQLKQKFFKELDMDIKTAIHFPKKLFRHEDNVKIAFIQFNTINEAHMAIKLITNADYKEIKACFAKGDTRNQNGTSVNAHNGASAVTRNGSEQIPEEFNCAFCFAVESKFLCGGCYNEYGGTYYCSEEHQARDWMRHKSECKPMPALKIASDHLNGVVHENPINLLTKNELDENGNETKSKFFITTIEQHPKVDDEVLITCVKSSRVIYIRPFNDNGGYEKLLQDVLKTGSSASKKLLKPEINDHILAPFRNSFHRAKVMDVFETNSDGNNLKVFMVDFGNEFMTRWQDCKDLNYRLRGLKSYVFKCILNGVQIGCDNETILGYLQSIQNNNEILMIASQVGDRKILKRSNEEIVNDQLNKLAVNSAVSINGSYEQVLYTTLILPKIESGPEIKIYIVDNSLFESKQMLACMPQENYAQYFRMMCVLKNYSKSIENTSYKPTIQSEIILVNYKGLWQRAFVLNLDKSQVAVTLVDTLINAFVLLENVRKIPKVFALQIFTQLCHVEGDNLNSPKMREKTEPGSVIVNVQINSDDHLPVLKFDI